MFNYFSLISIYSALNRLFFLLQPVDNEKTVNIILIKVVIKPLKNRYNTNSWTVRRSARREGGYPMIRNIVLRILYFTYPALLFGISLVAYSASNLN